LLFSWHTIDLHDSGPGASHHTAMTSLFVAWYNFCRKNQALRGRTPAMAAGLTDHVWPIEELLESAK
jgi:hypothetical protein